MPLSGRSRGSKTPAWKTALKFLAWGALAGFLLLVGLLLVMEFSGYGSTP